MTSTLSHAARAATAHHEAGHAVAAIMKGVPFKAVTIKATGHAAGHLAIKFGRGVEQMHKRGIVALAGEAAQRQFSPRSVRDHHGGSDREQVRLAAMDCTGSSEQAELLVRLWTVQARDLVLLRWPAVSQIAAALIEIGSLDRDQCSRMILPGLPNSISQV